MEIGIKGFGYVHAGGLGNHNTPNVVDDSSFIQWSDQLGYLVAALPSTLKEQQIAQFANFKWIKHIDPCTLFAIAAMEELKKGLHSSFDQQEVNLSIGTSRGASINLEYYIEMFLKSKLGALSPLGSPTTTIGNLASIAGGYHKIKGHHMVFSNTCASSLFSIINGSVWIKAGQCDGYIVGGSEAPLTPYTLKQLNALKVYSHEMDEYPCRAMQIDKNQNTMCLGEAACVFYLEEAGETSIATIAGWGQSIDHGKTLTDISDDGLGIQESMIKALKHAKLSTVDLVITHSPGTILGDRAESAAIHTVFETLPILYNNKWKYGHTLGASGSLSVMDAIQILRTQVVPSIPYLNQKSMSTKIDTVMVNATGFGGGTFSLILKRNQ
jgi:3-oxoacyl-(acyl-carrier-protein) synthase